MCEPREIIRITLESKDIEVVGGMAKTLLSLANDALSEMDGSRYMFDETESAAEALFLFLLNRIK